MNVYDSEDQNVCHAEFNFSKSSFQRGSVHRKITKRIASTSASLARHSKVNSTCKGGWTHFWSVKWWKYSADARWFEARSLPIGVRTSISSIANGVIRELRAGAGLDIECLRDNPASLFYSISLVHAPFLRKRVHPCVFIVGEDPFSSRAS